MPFPFAAKKSGPLRGRVRVPGDKSMSHRALIFGAVAIGETRITGLLESADVLATLRAAQQLGARAERNGLHWKVIGRGLGGLTQPAGPLDFGNAGTGARLMMGIVAGHDMEAAFTGDRSLCRRPMSRVLTPLRQMGLRTAGNDKNDKDADRLPLTLIGAADPLPIVYRLPVASAQVKSAVLLAGLLAPGETSVIEPERTRDHTEKMAAAFGAELSVAEENGARRITIKGQPVLQGCDIAIPGDPSSAAFIAAAALICPGSEIIIENVLINPARTGFYDTLTEMGARLSFDNIRETGGEPVADLQVKYGPLRGVFVPAGRAPRMIDEYPVLAALAAFAEGETRMEGLAELRVKESDRLAAMQAGLQACGAGAVSAGDCLTVTGTGAVPGGAMVKTDMDHRIAMAFLTMGLACQSGVAVDDVSMIETSFPGFIELMAGLGGHFAAFQDNPA